MLKAAIAKLQRQIKELEAEIIEIRDSDTFRKIVGIEDWDDYFRRMKEQLKAQLEELRLELT